MYPIYEIQQHVGDTSSSGHRERSRHILVSIVLVAVLLTVYSNTLHSPFIFDDIGNIVENGFIRIKNLSWDKIAYVWQAPHPCANRRIANLTFALNYLWGGYDPRGYHLVNIIIHIGCGLLVALFFFQTLKTGWLAKRYGPVRPWLVWGAAFLWALHPIQVNSVTYIVQRMTSLAVFFALLSMIAWLAGRRCWRQNWRARAIVYWSFGLVAWVLGLLCKEHVAIVPGLIMVHEFFLLRRGHFRLNWRWVLIGSAIASGIVIFYLGTEPWIGFTRGYEHRDFNLVERLMTESRVLWHYLSLFYVPVVDRFTLFYDYQISRGLFSPMTTIAGILSWAVVIAVAWTCRRRWPVLTWMSAWFLTSLLIESTVIPLEIIFEHRMYLPSVCLALGTVLLSFDFLSKRANRLKLQVIILVIVLLILGGATYTRNMDFKDAVTLYRAELAKHPNSKRIRLNLALRLNISGNFLEGGKLLENMAREYPDDILIQINWYSFLVNIRKDSLAGESTYQHIVQLLNKGYYEPSIDSQALWNTARFLKRIGNYKRALFLIEYLLIDFDYKCLWFLQGRCHAKLDDWDSAVQAFHKAWEKDPKDAPTLYWYGKSLLKAGEHDKGCQILIQAAQNPINEEVALKSRRLLENQHMKDSKR